MFGTAVLVGVLAFLVGGMIGIALGFYACSFGIGKKLLTHNATLEDDKLKWVKRNDDKLA